MNVRTPAAFLLVAGCAVLALAASPDPAFSVKVDVSPASAARVQHPVWPPSDAYRVSALVTAIATGRSYLHPTFEVRPGATKTSVGSFDGVTVTITATVDRKRENADVSVRASRGPKVIYESVTIVCLGRQPQPARGRL